MRCYQETAEIVGLCRDDRGAESSQVKRTIHVLNVAAQRATILSLTNAERQEVGAVARVMDQKLVEVAQAHAIDMAERVRSREDEAVESRLRAQQLALLEAVRQILVEAALLELVETQHGDLFAATSEHGFGAEVVGALERHGVPFRGLLSLLAGEELQAEAADPRFAVLQGLSPVQRRNRWEALKDRGTQVLSNWAVLAKRSPEGGTGAEEVRPPEVSAQWLGGLVSDKPESQEEDT